MASFENDEMFEGEKTSDHHVPNGAPPNGSCMAYEVLLTGMGQLEKCWVKFGQIFLKYSTSQKLLCAECTVTAEEERNTQLMFTHWWSP